MSYEAFREQGLVDEIRPNFRQVSALLARSVRDLETAQATLNIDVEWAYAITYQAMLRAARALLLAEGLRPRGRNLQKTTVLLAGEFLGEGLRTLVNTFDQMRRKREHFLERSDRPIPRYEAVGALKDARTFVERVVEVARARNPQLALRWAEPRTGDRGGSGAPAKERG
jgi:uncharacterized protein (UPF0332 family)